MKKSKRLLIVSLVRSWMLFQPARLILLFTDELLSKKRYLETARVYIDYAGDIRQAVIALVQGNELSEARRIVSISKPLGLYLLHLNCDRCHCTQRLNYLRM